MTGPDDTLTPDQGQPQAQPVAEPTAAELQARYAESQAKFQQQSWAKDQEIKRLKEELEGVKGKVYTDPYEAFKGLGGDFDEMVSRFANDGQPTPGSEINSLKEQVSQLLKEQKEFREDQRKQELSRKHSQYVNNMAGDIMRTLKSSDDYKELNDLLEFDSDMIGQDPQLRIASDIEGPIAERFKKTGQLLTPAEMLSTMNTNAIEALQKLRNSAALKRILGINQEPTDPHAEPLPELPRTVSQSAQTGDAPPEQDISKMPKGAFYQWASRFGNSNNS